MALAALKSEIQITHEKSEWAYAVYIMGNDGCEYSRRFEYDADVPGDSIRARSEALTDYKRQKSEHPGYNFYNDL